MSKSKLNDFKNGFLFGIRAEEKSKNYILRVEATSTTDALGKFTHAINAIKDNKLTLVGDYDVAGDYFSFYSQDEPRYKYLSSTTSDRIVDVRKHTVSQLVRVMSSEGQSWRLPDAVHAAIAALFILYDQDLVSMELRKVIKATEN